MSPLAALNMVLTFVLGIVPGTFFCVMAVGLGCMSLVSLVFPTFWGAPPSSALFALLVVPVAVMAVYGYIGLFYAAGDMVTPKVARWLLYGILATVFFVAILAREPEYFRPGAWSFFSSPAIVGGLHVARFLIRSRRRRASV